MKLPRREFLKTAAMAAAGLFLPKGAEPEPEPEGNAQDIHVRFVEQDTSAKIGAGVLDSLRNAPALAFELCRELPEARAVAVIPGWMYDPFDDQDGYVARAKFYSEPIGCCCVTFLWSSYEFVNTLGASTWAIIVARMLLDEFKEQEALRLGQHPSGLL